MKIGKQLILIIFAIYFLLYPFTLNSKGKNDPPPYTMLSESSIKNKSLQELLFRRAEVYGARGYIFPNKYFKDFISRKSWYKENQNFSIKDFTENEINYLNQLEERISQLKEEEKENKMIKLKHYTKDLMVIKFTKLADIDSDGDFELIAIGGAHFKNSDQYKNMDEATYRYYQEPNRLYLILIGDYAFGDFYAHTQITGSEKNMAEYISSLETGYFFGSSKQQIKVIIHSFPLGKYPPNPHKQKLYFFSLDKNKLMNIFSYEIYHVILEGKHERITQYDVQYKNVLGDFLKEIILKKRVTSRLFRPRNDASLNYRDQEVKGETLLFQYDYKLKSFKKVKNR